jgi:hypothetical protein
MLWRWETRGSLIICGASRDRAAQNSDSALVRLGNVVDTKFLLVHVEVRRDLKATASATRAASKAGGRPMCNGTARSLACARIHGNKRPTTARKHGRRVTLYMPILLPPRAAAHPSPQRNQKVGRRGRELTKALTHSHKQTLTN